MNVLAAPFLYTMPSEVEAFFCFSKFIEVSCPLYVQPTLEGVHRGLRVSTLTIDSLQLLYSALNSFSIDALKSWTQSCSTICAQKISRLNYTPFHVSTPLVPLSFSYLPMFSYPYSLCLHTSTGSSSPTLGLSSGFWGTS
jgi:hypothetical protein